MAHAAQVSSIGRKPGYLQQLEFCRRRYSIQRLRFCTSDEHTDDDDSNVSLLNNRCCCGHSVDHHRVFSIAAAADIRLDQHFGQRRNRRVREDWLDG
jgi:hypothetical protein